MRNFEILLVTINIISLILFTLRKNISKRFFIIILTLSTIIFILQTVFEGYRWQISIQYLIYFILLFFIFKYIIINKHIKTHIFNKTIKFFILFIISISFLLTIFITIMFPVFNLPQPTGKYKVGTQVLQLIDNNRNELFTENTDDKREIVIQIWYPTSNTNTKKTKYLFPQDKKIFSSYKEELSKGLKIPSFIFDYWKYIKTNSYKSVSISNNEKNYPLVIISHGFNVMKELHSTQAENLASNGFIVVAIDHTFCSLITTFPDSQKTISSNIDMLSTEEILDKKNYIGDIWYEDIKFIINELLDSKSNKINSTIKNKIDKTNTGIIGHSFGGATAIYSTYKLDNIKSGISMDSLVFNEEEIRDFKKPFMYMTTDYSKYINSNRETPTQNELSNTTYEKLKSFYANQCRIIDSIKENNGYCLYINNTKHYNFIDFQLYSKLLGYMGITGKINGERNNFIINTYILEFFNEHLKGIKSEFLGKNSNDFPEVKFDD